MGLRDCFCGYVNRFNIEDDPTEHVNLLIDPTPEHKLIAERYVRPAATYLGAGPQIYLGVDPDLAVDLSPQRNDVDPQRIRSPPS